MKGVKKKENPFSFFSIVKEESNNVNISSVDKSPPTIENTLPVFNNKISTSTQATSTKKPVANIFDEDDDDDEEEEEDDDDTDDDSSKKSIFPTHSNTKLVKPQILKDSSTSTPNNVVNTTSRLNSLFIEQLESTESEISLEKTEVLKPSVQQPLNSNRSTSSNNVNSNNSNTVDLHLLNNTIPLPTSVPIPVPTSTNIANNNNVTISPSPTTSTSTLDDIKSLKMQIEHLQSENSKSKVMIKSLKERVVKFKGDKEGLEHKLEQATNALEQFKIKEAKDNLLMEEMVAKVEENLNQTKKRAQQAEQHVEQLKNEIVMLKQFNSQNNPEIQDLKFRLTDANDKGKLVSSLLNKAAIDADVNIKNLMRGIETLQNITFHLNNLDKISNLPP
ncbi:hypothetical protein DLAC_03493 [Tieghemostelium lacteum]|uniref:Endosome-associated-trafficking regulator 1 n=1 Tax=Tieghemostelium lacteum TaxID=361077 RepID=A0A152A178_TIELA|nr:hypothetical protein DLAC_03493 [Tieghemostelium lacteum]|eukprot:KYQ99997.1 hypothetical protein DLAC_03493 [Tieghemostelium lacteum]